MSYFTFVITVIYIYTSIHPTQPVDIVPAGVALTDIKWDAALYRVRGEQNPGGERKGKERQKEGQRTRYMGFRIQGGKKHAWKGKERQK